MTFKEFLEAIPHRMVPRLMRELLKRLTNLRVVVYVLVRNGVHSDSGFDDGQGPAATRERPTVLRLFMQAINGKIGLLVSEELAKNRCEHTFNSSVYKRTSYDCSYLGF